MLALDTNILIYAAQDADDPRKQRALAVVTAGALAGAVISMQALSEFANACHKKGLLAHSIIASRVAAFATTLTVTLPTPADVVAALTLMEGFRLSFYDALICATCRRAGASTLFSEDMQDGVDIDGLRILNPFNPDNDSVIAALFASTGGT